MNLKEFFNNLFLVYISWAIGTIIGLVLIMTIGDNVTRLIETGHWNRQRSIVFISNNWSGYAPVTSCNGDITSSDILYRYITASDILESDSTITAVVWTPTDSVVTKEMLELQYIKKISEMNFPKPLIIY